MKRIWVMEVCLLFLILAVGTTFGQQKAGMTGSNAADVKALRDTDTAWAAACKAKDLDKCVGFYADNAVMLEPGSPIKTTKAAIREMWSSLLNTPGMSASWHTTQAEVSRSGDMGYTFGAVTITANGADGKPVTTRAKYVTVWKKMADGSWKAVVDTYNEDAPPPPPPPPAPKKRQ